MAGYLGAIPVPQATQHRETFTASSGQTTFNTAGYTVGFLDVYLNGSHLSPADFTATNGSDVVLASGASADDVCDIISYTAFEVNSQTFTGTTTLDGAVVINESSADVDFRVESNGNANMLFVDGGNNRVGVGTNTPTDTLNVQAAAAGTAITLVESSDSGSNPAAFVGYRSRGTDLSGHTAIQASNTMTQFSAGAHDGSAFAVGSKILSTASQTWTTSAHGTRLGIFITPDNSTTPVERMRIHSSGSFQLSPAGNQGTFRFGNQQGDGSGIGAQFYLDSSQSIWYNSTTSTADKYHAQFINGNGLVGHIKTNGSATAYNTSSDYRLKTDAQPMTGASARVLALNPVNFEWIADGTRVDGFLAHEAQAVVPECVTGTKDAMMDEEYEVTPAVLDADGNETKPAVMGTRSVPDMQGIDQSKLVPLLVASLQEALARITALENA